MAKSGGKLYRPILLWVFKHAKHDPNGNVLFSQADLRNAAEALGLAVRNFPDLTYNLRSRSELPTDILAEGYTTIAIVGRGKYALVKAQDKIEIPADTEIVDISTKTIPKIVQKVLRADEQSILSAMAYMDVISDFVEAKSHHVQGHLRTSGGLGQQVEADDVWTAEVQTGEKLVQVIFPVEAKGPKERIGLHQMMSTVEAVLKKFPGYPVVPLAAQLLSSGLLVLIELSYEAQDGKIVSVEPKRFKKYRPLPTLPLWR